MPSFDIIKNSEASESFKTKTIIGQYDLDDNKITEHFTGDLPYENMEWNIGAIVGTSGSGKTIISKHIFGENYISSYEYDSRPIIDNFGENTTTEITDALTSVGFSSPPSWLKPYSVLSEGEKMRVNLARAILEKKDMVAFDEFTSVVDRDVAKVGSMAIEKAVRKAGKKFIAITCHYDILEWLSPDWIYDVNAKKFIDSRGLLRRPDIRIDIYEEKNRWDIFKKHHYLDENISSSAKQYVGYYNGKPICFCAVLHQVHARTKAIKRVSRIVVLPDYQGIGVGTRLINTIGEINKNENKRLVITTSHYSFTRALRKSGKWKMTSKTRKAKHSGLTKQIGSAARLTASFEYAG